MSKARLIPVDWSCMKCGAHGTFNLKPRDSGEKITGVLVAHRAASPRCPWNGMRIRSSPHGGFQVDLTEWAKSAPEAPRVDMARQWRQ